MRLQWGRSGEGAEDVAWAGKQSRRNRRFNGAAPVKERKTFTHDGETTPEKRLQWGRSGEGAEDGVTEEHRTRSSMLQWGRSGEGAEDAAIRLIRPAGAFASMGPLR